MFCKWDEHLSIAYIKPPQEMAQFLTETVIQQCVGLIQHHMVYTLHVVDACKHVSVLT
jgi:adenosylmethionine-8-amino-7-oxononanoate aminotransferase